jgi:Family of unknown function (DUF6328)
VILPGVQVLFAFLLMVPFTQRFPDLDDLETGVFFILPAIVGVVFVITAFIFGLTAAVVVTGLLALLFVMLWFVFPLRYRGKED